MGLFSLRILFFAMLQKDHQKVKDLFDKLSRQKTLGQNDGS